MLNIKQTGLNNYNWLHQNFQHLFTFVSIITNAKIISSLDIFIKVHTFAIRIKLPEYINETLISKKILKRPLTQNMALDNWALK